MMYTSLRQVYIARIGLSLFATMAVMLWATEVHSQSQKSQSKPLKEIQQSTAITGYKKGSWQRSPASMPESSRFGMDWTFLPESLSGLEASSNSSQILLNLRGLKPTESILLGKNVSLSFKENPFYVPANWILMRFKTK